MKKAGKTKQKLIYLDHAGSTEVNASVKKSMKDVEDLYTNPSAIYSSGVHARSIIDDARKSIAKQIFAHQDEIIFTSSATESIALAMLGTVRASGIKKPHIVTSMIEHPAVIENCKMLEERGEARVTYVAPDEYGIIDPKSIRDAITKDTVLVTIMYANNEIGTIEPIEDIAKVIRHYKKNNQSLFPVFHTDACQAMNYLDVSNIEKLGVDMLTFNSSKIYGPKGIAVLYKKRNVKLSPLYSGGGQEHSLRSGTESVELIVGLSKALEVTNKLKNKETKRLTVIRDYAIKKLLALSKGTRYEVRLNGDSGRRLPNNVNISISGISSELLVIELDAKGIAVSSKSACKSTEDDESYVISALRKAQGIKADTTEGSLRMTMGRGTTKGDIDTLVAELAKILHKYSVWK